MAPMFTVGGALARKTERKLKAALAAGEYDRARYLRYDVATLSWRYWQERAERAEAALLAARTQGLN